MSRSFSIAINAVVMVAAGAVALATGGAQGPSKPAPTDTAVSRAVAVLLPTKGSAVGGTVSFSGVKDGVRVVAQLTGLEPGPHGFHIHEFGDCSSTDGSAAGPHFNPRGEAHGGPQDSHRHVGDLGNIQAAADGTATLDYVDRELGWSGDKNIVGRGVVVHAKSDDLKTQPAGDAGSRLACGVIGVAKP